MEQLATDLLEEDYIVISSSNIVITRIILNIAFRTYCGIALVIGAWGGLQFPLPQKSCDA